MKVRCLLICVAVLFIVGLLTTSSYAKIDPQTCVGMWLFDEGSGNVAKDSSENKNDGTLMNDPKWVDGKFGKALEFDGVDDYVEIPDSNGLDITNNITIVCWVLKRPSSRGTVVGKWKQVGDVWSYVLYDVGEGGGGFRLRWGDGSQTNLEGPYQLPTDEWVHYAATYDGSIMKVFVNGKEIVNIAAKNKINVETNPVWIGNDGYQQHFKGMIDDVAILNAALSEGDVIDIMTKGLSTVSNVSSSGKLTTTWANIKAQ